MEILEELFKLQESLTKLGPNLRDVSWDTSLCNSNRSNHSFTCTSMSAKEFYKKPRLHVPELPPEIWMTVLRHATRNYEFPFPSELTFESIGISRFSSAPLRSFRKTLVNSCTLLSIHPDLHR